MSNTAHRVGPRLGRVSWLSLALLWTLRAAPVWAEEPCVTASLTPASEERDDVLREARGYAERGRYAEARALYRWLFQRRPDDREARVAHARVDAWDHCFERAAAQYEALLRERPDDLDALLGSIDLLAWTGRLREAQAATARGLGFAPNAAELWLRSAKLSSWTGERERAIEHANRAERLSPHDREIRTFRDGLFQTQLRVSALISRFPAGYPRLYVETLQAQQFLGPWLLDAEAQLIERVGGALDEPLVDGLYSVGAAYHLLSRLSVGFGLGFGAPDHTVPRFQLKPSLFYQVTSRWSAGLGYARWGYRDKKTAHLMSATLGLALGERVLLELRSLTSYVVLAPQPESTTRAKKIVSGAGVRLSLRLRPWLRLAGGYTYGPQIEQASSYQFLGLTSHIFNVAGDWLLKRGVGIQPSFTLERRNSPRANTVLVYTGELASYFRW